MTILENIASYKREEVARAKTQAPLGVLEKRIRLNSAPRGFRARLLEKQSGGQFALIAEIKKASPSKGIIREDLNPEALARAYEQGGATCLSVLTDTPSFQGRLESLQIACEATRLPILRKDFMLDPYQVAEARAFGADCILVILAMVDDAIARALMEESKAYGMDTLVEVHDEPELQRALALGAKMISNDNAAPVDRPNLSKDYLAGNAPEDWVPLRGDDWYADNKIDLRLNTSVTALDPRSKEVTLGDGSKLKFDKLLLATGAEPVKLNIPGADQPHVHMLRSLADSRAIITNAKTAKRAVVIGASFIGLETAASLRAREIEVHVIAPEKRPLERVFGPQFGDFIRALHEEHGVNFHLENSVTAIGKKDVTLKNGGTLDADLVVIGVGVRPRITLAEQAGLKIDKGVNVDQYLQTNAPDIYAAGDIARWPDPISGAKIRVEHWVVAERQGQTAALNMLGERRPYRAVPFFWSQHYDVPINYVGHAESWDEVDVEGDVMKRDCVVRYKQGGRVLAVASIYRDLDSLKAAAEMETRAATGP